MSLDDGLTDHCGCCAHRRSTGCGGPGCPCRSGLSDVEVVIEAARKQHTSLRQKQIAHLADLLASTRQDGIEGEWAHRLWDAGVRVNRFRFSEDD